MKTKEKRLSQRCVVYKIKVNEDALTKKQKEELKMLFVEGKWFYNHELRLLKDGTFKDTDPLDIKTTKAYGQYDAICLEAQMVPNAVNLPQFDSPVIKAGKKVYHACGYRFV